MVRELEEENKQLKAQNMRLSKQAKIRLLSASKNCALRNKVTGLEGVIKELTNFFTKEISWWSDVTTSLPKTRKYLAEYK